MTSQLQHLAAVVTRIERLRVEVGQLRSRIELLRGGFTVVDGEDAHVRVLEAFLVDAARPIASLADPAAEPVKLLEQLDAIVGDPAWELTTAIADELKRKVDVQVTEVGTLQRKIDAWPGKLTPLRDALADARAVRAATRTEAQHLVRIEDLERAARQALEERRYDQVRALCEDLDAQDVQASIASVKAKTEEARRYMRQAELLLIRSPVDDRKRHHYALILRTPSEPGSHGINLQDTTTLSDSDRQAITLDATRLAASVSRHRARGATADGATEAHRDVAAPDVDVRALASQASAVGDRMFRLVIPEEMKRYLRDAPCSVTITTNDLEPPWELMCSNGGFLCLDRPVARMPMGQALPRADRPPTPPRRTLRFLLLGADKDNNLPSVFFEIDKIDAALRSRFGNDVEIDVKKTPDATGEALNESLRQAQHDVIHYAGHASIDAANPDLNALCMDDGDFFAQKARRMTEGRPLVFLNACDTGWTRNEAAQSSRRAQLTAPAEGLAAAFIYGGALGCIGNLWPVYDQAAADFAIATYIQLLEGYSIGEAMLHARHKVHASHPHDLSWASFVLFGNPSFRLGGND